MRRLIPTTLCCMLALGLAACDKQDAPKPTTEPDASPPEPAETDEATPDDTKGLATLVRELAGDERAAAAAEGAPTYDTSQDAGGLIGHVATGLSHDDALATSKTTLELHKLAGESDDGPSDMQICGHVWTEVFAAAYPDRGESEDAFMKACKSEVEKQRVKLGVEIFAQHASCVLASKELAALDLCDAAEQGAEDELHQNPHGDGADRETCHAAVEHMFILISRDMTDDPDMLEVLEEDIYQIKEDAVLTCRDEATKAELDCVMKAAALADLEAC